MIPNFLSLVFWNELAKKANISDICCPTGEKTKVMSSKAADEKLLRLAMILNRFDAEGHAAQHTPHVIK